MRKYNNNQTGDFSELRKRAEAWLAGKGNGKALPMTREEVRKLVHELHTYQVELELQNEDLRLAQAELGQSRRRYSDLYDFAPFGYLTVDYNGVIQEANLTAAEMLGLHKQQLLHQPFTMYVVDEDQHIFSHFRKNLMISSKPQSCELRMRKDDNSTFYALLESAVNADIDGNAGQLRITISDISARKKLEDTLDRSRKEWQSTFDSMSDLITILDTNYRIVRANKATYEVFNAEFGSLNGKQCYEFFPGDNKLCLGCPAPNSVKYLSPQSATITNDKLGKVFHITCTPLQDESGECTRIVHIARDVTLQKKIEAELLQTQKMEAIGTLAGGIAHDFNNILAAILGYADIVRATPTIPEESRNHLEQIVKAANRAQELVKQILTFSRRGQETKLPLDLSPIIKEALKLMRASIPTTVEIHEEVASACGNVVANPINIHQILVNLCTNAIHAMENEKGILTVKLQRVELPTPDDIGTGKQHETPFVELMVSDTGCGMEEETVKRIFEPYFTTKDFSKGSGVGLSVVHGIVSGCGGFIDVESAPGSGTTFHVYFPIIQDQAVQPGEVYEEAIPMGNERILLVDDEEAIVVMHTLLLEQLGYTVTGFTSSRKALQAFCEAPDHFDLVITDQTMPHLTGLELVQKMLQIRPDMPIILCTGYSSFASETTASIYGVKQFLMKPVGRLGLATAVRDALDREQ